MKQNLISLGKLIGMFFIMILVFFLLVMISYILPKERIKNNAFTAIDSFTKEGTYYSGFFENSKFEETMQADNYTDAIILNVASDNNKEDANIVEKAVTNKHYANGESPVKSFIETGDEEIEANSKYVRYWFGTITVLKPLLTFISYQTIRYFNVIAIFVLLFYAVWLIGQKLHAKYAFAFLVSMLVAGIYTVPMSLQFVPVFAIMLISTIIILQFYEKEFLKKNLKYLFLLIGGLTAFNDLLTAPLLTFGIPIIILVLLRNKYENTSLKKDLRFVIKYGIIWALSYTMTYLSKWIIASIVLNNNEIKIAFDQFTYRTGSIENTKIDALKVNIQSYFNKYVIFALVAFSVLYLAFVPKRKHYRNINYKRIIILCIIAILPYIWFVGLSNHSNMHFWFTYRIQAITMFAILSVVLGISDEKNIIEKEK